MSRHHSFTRFFSRRSARHANRLDSLNGAQRLRGLAPENSSPRSTGGSTPKTPRETLSPPPPPLTLTAALACDPATDPETLWFIARQAPDLRRWLVANPAADAALLEYISQSGGPGVKEALEILLG